jgi:transposase
LEQSPKGAKLDAICDSQRRPLGLFVPAGQVSDYICTRALLRGLRNDEWLLVSGGYDANWLREALEDNGVRA